jgi:NAD(P)-dependent dehydrogenase (short-subunit alcohol dehydrogenase family)
MLKAWDSLEGRIAVVTGSGSGMGRASAELFAAQGAIVVVADINEEAAAQTVASIKENGKGDAVAYRLDAGDLASIKGMMNLVEKEFGRLNVLFSHVGSPGPGGLDLTEEQWTQTIDLNLKSAFFCASYGEHLLRKEAGHASIIFTASVSGLVGSLFSPIYSMCKGGIVSIAKALALSLAPDIRTNVIAPGVVETPMLAKFIDTGVPLNRVCTAEEIAQVALFLASDQSQYMTGVTLPVDGGYVAR